MPEATKKRHTDEDMVTLRLRVHRSNAPRIKEYAQIIEAGDERNYTIAEVFPEYIGKEQQVAIRAYRYRENLTQRQLAELTGIPKRHIRDGKRQTGYRQGTGQAAGQGSERRLQGVSVMPFQNLKARGTQNVISSEGLK